MSNFRPLKFNSILWFIGSLILFGVFTVNCGMLSPPLKLPSYLGDDSLNTKNSSLTSFVGSRNDLRIGLIPVFDTSEPDSAPALSDDNHTRFLAEIIQRTEESLPVKIVKVFRTTDFKPGKGPKQFVPPSLGRDIDGILVMLISDTESQSPAYLHLAPEVGSLPGYQTQNFSLIEMVLLEPSEGYPLLQAHGRAYATLEHLADPLASNRYPNVRRSSQPGAMYPRANDAHEVLRMVALSDALYQAIWKFKEQWNNSLGTS